MAKEIKISESTLDKINELASIYASKYKGQWNVTWDDWYQEVWVTLLTKVRDTIDSNGGDPFYYERPRDGKPNSYGLLNKYADNICKDKSNWWRRRHYTETPYDDGITGTRDDGPADPSFKKRAMTDLHIRNVDKYDLKDSRREAYDDGKYRDDDPEDADDFRDGEGKTYTGKNFTGRYENSMKMTGQRMSKTFKSSDTKAMISEMYTEITKKFGVASREWYFFTGMLMIQDLIDYVASKIPKDELKKILKVEKPLDIAADLMKVGKTGNHGYIKAANNVRDFLTQKGYTL